MSSILISNSTETGHTWTIVSKLGDILRVAEQKYGPRDLSYTILGIEFNQDGHPRIWFPGDCKHLIIQISMNCLNDLNRAVFQVSHEAIHCLSPTGTKKANVLEEGLATHFSIYYTLTHNHGVWKLSNKKYINAYNLAQRLLEIDNNIIKKLRLIQPTLSLIDKELILKINPDVPEDLADSLTCNF